MNTNKISLLIAFILSTALWVGATGPVYSASTQDELSSPAEADLERVIWRGEHYPNPGFEEWDYWYLPDDVTSYFTTEKYTGYVSAPWPVSEGSRSYLLQARAIVPYNYPEARLTRQMWTYWNNPTNLTLKLDWYLDQMPTAVDGDVFELRVFMGAPATRELHYYFGCESTTMTNSSSRGYFFIDGPLNTWNTLDRNITADHFELFGDYPTQFRLFHIAVLGTSTDYARGFVDDIQMVNGSVIIGGSIENGNFESSSAWYVETNYEPGVISLSTTRQEGDFSLNMTVISNGNRSETRISAYPYRWVSATNLDVFSFSWRLEDLAVSDRYTYSYVYVSCTNGTQEFYLYYMLTYGDVFLLPIGNAQKIQVTGFNTTGQWHTFSRSIYNDVANAFDVDNLRIDEIRIQNYARTQGARNEILFDGISLSSALMSDMSYESQGSVGDLVYAWRDTSSGFTVTDFAHTGAKGANLTIADDEYASMEQYFGHLPVNEHTDLWVDLFWYLNENSEHSDNEVFMQFGFYDEISDEYNSILYYFLNSSPIETGEGYDAYVLLDGIDVEGAWHNMQRNLYDDYVAAFNGPLDGNLEYVYIEARAASGGRVEIYFDDVYVYTDPEPLISSVVQSPTSPTADDVVNVTASVYDLSLYDVTLFYRVDNGTWSDVDMTLSGSQYLGQIPAQPADAVVEYFVEASDAFGNSAVTSYYTYDVEPGAEPTPPPNILPLVAGVGVAIAVLVVILGYLFYLKPRVNSE